MSVIFQPHKISIARTTLHTSSFKINSTLLSLNTIFTKFLRKISNKEIVKLEEVAASLNSNSHDEVVIHMNIDGGVLFDVDKKFIEAVEGILNFCEHID